MDLPILVFLPTSLKKQAFDKLTYEVKSLKLGDKNLTSPPPIVQSTAILQFYITFADMPWFNGKCEKYSDDKNVFF